jgi:lysylphosphatidylglycerol synthetase-like protein (DUF2156 family)
VQLSTRVEDGRQVRVIVWNPTTTSDLSAVVAPVVLAVVLAGFIVAAVETAGWVRILCVVLAVVAGVYWALIAGTLGVIALGIYVGKGLLAETPTRAQQAAFAVPHSRCSRRGRSLRIWPNGATGRPDRCRHHHRFGLAEDCVAAHTDS